MKLLFTFLSDVNKRSFILLITGIVLIGASNMSFGVDIIAWVAYVPFLLYVNMTNGWKSKLYLFMALIAAWSFAVLKIVTPPIPYAMIFLFSIPIAIFHLPAYLIGAYYKKSRFSLVLFPALLTIIEWIQYTFTPFAGWGAAAYSQVNSLVLIQSLSVFGLPGLSFIIYLVNSSIAIVIAERRYSFTSVAVPVAFVAALVIYGNLRINISRSSGVDTIKVAAVGTDSDIQGLPLPDTLKNERVIKALFDRTNKASSSGAKLVVWNEASFYVLPEVEETMVKRLRHLSDTLDITLVASYIVPKSINPLQYNNKYVISGPEGDVLYTYHKHEPVPGEPAQKGIEEFKVTDVEGVKVGGAICYDYDFPYIAKEFGNLKADIVALPSSDWRGIDPLHTQMAAFRAIEQGHSVIRSTRYGLSAALSPYGDVISKMSSFDNNSRIMLAEVPKKGITTIYSATGDLLIIILILLVILIIGYRFYNR